MKRALLAVFLVFVITGAMLSIAAVYVPAIVTEGKAKQEASGGLFIIADELSEKPQSYFVLDNSDAYVLQAVSNPGKSVHFGSAISTQLNEIFETYDGNVESNSHYYSLTKLYATPLAPEALKLIPILNAGWILWGTSIIIVAIITIIIQGRRKHSNKTLQPH